MKVEFNINYIINKYEKDITVQRKNRKFLYYPSSSKSLIVCFTTLGPHIYERVRMFWQEDEVWPYNFLFISDNSGTNKWGQYYLGSHLNRDIESETIEIINCVKEEYQIENIITIGSSMGGYAALYYAIKYNFLGALSVVPQVNEEIINDFGWEKWKVAIKEIGTLPSLLEIINHAEELPNLFIQYGTYSADEVAGEALFKSLNVKNGFFIKDKFDKKEHTSDFLSKDLTYNIFNLFVSLENGRIKGGIH